jgi:polyphosphate kinase
VVPVADPDLASELARFLELELADDTLAWELTADGTWHKPSNNRGSVNAQELMQRATLGLVEKGVAAV